MCHSTLGFRVIKKKRFRGETEVRIISRMVEFRAWEGARDAYGASIPFCVQDIRGGFSHHVERP